MNQKISFIIAVLNGETWVERCLSSLRRQTYPNFEAIVVDDGSSDGSLAKCEAFAKNDVRFRICAIPHGGLSSARNFGLGQVQGDYIGFLDIDDWIEDSFAELLLRTLLSHNAEMVSCLSVSTKGAPDRSNSIDRNAVPVRSFTPGDYLALEYRDPEVNVRVGNRLYSRRLFENVRFPSERLYEDVVTNYKLCRQCKIICHVPLPLHNYYVDNHSITRSPLQKSDLDLPGQWEQILEMAGDEFPALIPLIRAMQVTALRTLADKYLCYGGDPAIAKCLTQAFRRSFLTVLSCGEIPWNRKLRSLAAMIDLRLYRSVTEITRRMGN